MFMAQEASTNHATGQLKPWTGAAQRSGAKSGAKRWNLNPSEPPKHEIKAANQIYSLNAPPSPSFFSH
jgi:hypothetical protein